MHTHHGLHVAILCGQVTQAIPFCAFCLEGWYPLGFNIAMQMAHLYLELPMFYLLKNDDDDDDDGDRKESMYRFRWQIYR